MKRCASCRRRSYRWNKGWSSLRTMSWWKLLPSRYGCGNASSPRICDRSEKRPLIPRIQNFRLPRVYALTNVQLSGLSHAEQVQLLSLGGASLVQLREKQMPALEFYE